MTGRIQAAIPPFNPPSLAYVINDSVTGAGHAVFNMVSSGPNASSLTIAPGGVFWNFEVSEAGSLLLAASGLMGLVAIRKRRK